MKILHLLFDDYPYVIDWGYQENKFVKYQLEEYDVVIVTGRYIPDILKEYLDFKMLKKYEVFQTRNHILKIYRLDCLFGNSFLGKKIKYYCKLNEILYKEKPDYILVHDLHALSLITLDRYLKNNLVKCNADVHINYANSCRNILSFLVHRYFYRYIIQNNISKISTIFYLNENSKQYIEKIYGLDENKHNLRFLPLGGDVEDLNVKSMRQNQFKKEHYLSNDSIIFIHSGKMNHSKKTLDILDEFNKINDEKFCLLLIGSPSQEIRNLFYEKISKNQRIHYLGWRTNEELMDYLMVCDVYLQPGTPSVTAHEAFCKGCAVILSQEGDFYMKFVDEESAIYINDERTLKQILRDIKASPEYLNAYKKRGHELAVRMFNYKIQSELVLK